MSARFLQQLARRALAASDVRPRIAARFESLAPEPAEDAGTIAAPVVDTTHPRPALAPAATLPQIETRESPQLAVTDVSASRATHTVIERQVMERPAPVLAQAEPLARPASPVLPQQTPPRETPAVRAVAEPLLALPLSAPAAPSVREGSAPPGRESRELRDPPRGGRAEATRIEPVAPMLVASTPVVTPRWTAHTAPAVPRQESSPALAPIEVVIGRIEIRADSPPAAAPRAAPARRPAMSLDDYLRGRGGPR